MLVSNYIFVSLLLKHNHDKHIYSSREQSRKINIPSVTRTLCVYISVIHVSRALYFKIRAISERFSCLEKSGVVIFMRFLKVIRILKLEQSEKGLAV